MLRCTALLATTLLCLVPLRLNAATSVEVITASEQTVPRRVELSGQLSAAQHAALSPRLAGVVEQLAVDAGARVARGDRLLKLDDQLARLSLDSAEAALRGAAARLADAERVEKETAPLA